MVVFTCNHCGDSLQKPKVEKHYSGQCRNAKYLTCVDCLKDFKNEEYVAHIKCVTEEQRYSAKGAVPTGLKKGEIKQESWVEMIASIVKKETNLKPSLKNLLETISGYTNVPRKKAKFINFLRNSSGGRVNLNDVEAAWGVIEKYKKEKAEADQTTKKSVKNGENEKRKLENCEENAPSKKKKVKNDVEANEAAEEENKLTTNEKEHLTAKKKKRKMEVEENGKSTEEKAKKKKCNKSEVIANGNDKQSLKNVKNGKDTPKENNENSSKIDENCNSETFSFKKIILDILSSKNSISLAKLQKKVMNSYSKQTGNEINEKSIKKYNKKLKKIPEIKIDNECASLVNL